MAQAWYGIGVTYEEEERWYEAMYYIKKALENDDQNGEYWLALGDCEYQLGNFPEADDCYSKSIKVDPDNVDAWIAYSDLLHDYNLNHRAVALLVQGLAHHQGNIEMHYRIVAYLFLIGNIETCMAELERALQIDYNQHRIIFEIAPAMLNDERTNWIINTNKNI
jgi:tetratricopeptide (TPR) repeat protein